MVVVDVIAVVAVAVVVMVVAVFAAVVIVVLVMAVVACRSSCECVCRRSTLLMLACENKKAPPAKG